MKMKTIADAYEHQRVLVERLASSEQTRWYIADRMGLGKTVEALLYAQTVLQRGARVLVICPASAIPNWLEHAREWTSGLRLTVESYATRRLATFKKHHDFSLVILDEAHYVKQSQAQRTAACLFIAAKAPRALLLSATPMPNHPGELYAPCKALWRDRFDADTISSYDKWLRYFTHYIVTKYGVRPVRAKNGKDMRAALDTFMVRRSLTDAGLNLPPLRVDTFYLEQDKALEKAIRDIGIDVEDLRAGMANAKNASQLRRLLGTYKAPIIANQLEQELYERQYDKIVVMAYHHDTIGLLWDKLSQFGVTSITGKHHAREREEAVRRFRDDPNVRVFLAQQTAAGVALNLQNAAEIVLVEPDWSPDNNAQAVGRIHRIGQRHPCRARVFAVRNTLDAALMGVAANKERMQKAVGL